MSEISRTKRPGPPRGLPAWIAHESLPVRLAIFGPVGGAVVGLMIVLGVGVVLLISSAVQFGQLYAGYVIELVFATIISLVVGLAGGVLCSLLAGALIALARRATQSRRVWAALGAVAAAVGATMAIYWLAATFAGLLAPWFAWVIAPLAAAGYFLLILSPYSARLAVGASAPTLDLV